MKDNKGKCRLVISNNEKVSVKIDNIEIESTSSEKLLDITIDSKLNFNPKTAEGVNLTLPPLPLVVFRKMYLLKRE